MKILFIRMVICCTFAHDLLENDTDTFVLFIFQVNNSQGHLGKKKDESIVIDKISSPKKMEFLK